MTCLLRIWAEHCSCLEVQGRLLVSQSHYGYAMLRMVQTRKMPSGTQTRRECREEGADANRQYRSHRHAHRQCRAATGVLQAPWISHQQRGGMAPGQGGD